MIVAEDTANADVRLALARTYVGLMRMARERTPGASLREIFVLAAVIVGTLEDRPMNANKISGYTGLPHQTVGRILNTLIKRGYIVRKGRVGGGAAFIAHQLPPITDLFVRQLVSVLVPALHTFHVHNGHNTSRGNN